MYNAYFLSSSLSTFLISARLQCNLVEVSKNLFLIFFPWPCCGNAYRIYDSGAPQHFDWWYNLTFTRTILGPISTFPMPSFASRFLTSLYELVSNLWFGRPTEWSHHRRATPWPTYVITLVDAYIFDIAIFSSALVMIFENFHDLCLVYQTYYYIKNFVTIYKDGIFKKRSDWFHWFCNWELFLTWFEIMLFG